MTDRGPETLLRDKPPDALQRVASARVFFGHQSVGGNIVEGLGELQTLEPRLTLRVASIDDVSSLTGGYLSHARLGRNGDPRGKTDAFATVLDTQLRDRVDIAFHKYCYVDIDQGTDVRALFENYRAVMARLAQAHPHVTFVHMTVPIVKVQGGLKGLLKGWAGRELDHYADNVARERFNGLLREAYGRDHLFDLAAAESTYPDGRRERVASSGTSTFSLVPSFSSDGAHLNPRGRQMVAAELIAFLSALPAR
jgi:hypothetical protein